MGIGIHTPNHRFAGRALALALLVGLIGGVSPRPALAATLAAPSAWDIIANGHDGRLTIHAIDGHGNVSASLTLRPGYIETVSGFWDEEDRKLTLLRRDWSSAAARQVYTGYLLHRDGVAWLAGTFAAMAAHGGSPTRSVFAWQARQVISADRNCVCAFRPGAAASLPLHRSFDLISNGALVRVTITAIDAAGNVSGQLTNGAHTVQISGFWDHDAQRLSFLRNVNSAYPGGIQVYTGYLMTAVTTTGDVSQRYLAGAFEAFAFSGGSAARSVFGWSAALD